MPVSETRVTCQLTQDLSFPQEFGIATPVGEPGGNRDEWIVGFVNSSPYISACLLGCWISDPLNNWFGRRGEIFITAIMLIATPIASGFTHSWQALAAVRLVMGVGVGAKAATVAMYCAEISPAAIRGALTMGWQLWTAFGIFLGFCANAAVKDTGKIAWRLQLGSAFIPAVPLAIGVLFCPESPRWYMKKGRITDAWTSMKKIRNTELQAARDLVSIALRYTKPDCPVLRLRPVCRGAKGHSRSHLHHSPDRMLHHPSLPSRHPCRFRRHARSTDVWHKHCKDQSQGALLTTTDGILLVHNLQRGRLN